MADTKRDLDELRKEIAKQDAQILAALEKRGRASRRIGELQKHLPHTLLSDGAALRQLEERAHGDLPREVVRAVFRAVFAAFLPLELPAEITFVGPEGSPCHAAALSRFGDTAALRVTDGVRGALDELARKRAHYAVVPFETVSEGPVQVTVQELAASELKIVELLERTIPTHVVTRSGTMADVERIFASTADHALCERTLASLGTSVAIVDLPSPRAACEAASTDPHGAALAIEVFAVGFGLRIARRDVLDRGAEGVRYAVVGFRPAPRTGNDMTAFVFTLGDAPGMLLDVLRQFADRGVNLTRIQSRPIKGEGWSYLFFVEVVGHATDRSVVAAFEEIRKIAKSFKVLGSFAVS